jgi:hypothetical protein
MTVILAIRRLGQEDQKLKASLSYIANPISVTTITNKKYAGETDG